MTNINCIKSLGINYPYVRRLKPYSVEYYLPGYLITEDFCIGNNDRYQLSIGVDIWLDGWAMRRAMEILFGGDDNFPWKLYPGGGAQFYIDNLILGITPNNRPKCKRCGCELSFKSISTGYGSTNSDNILGDFCSKSCHARWQLENPDLNPTFTINNFNENRNKLKGYSWGRISKIYLSKINKEVEVKSNLEKYSLIWCNNSDEVEYFEYEPENIIIDYELEGEHYKYIPDILIKYKSGLCELVECKYSCNLEYPVVLAKKSAAVNYCKLHNMKYTIWTEFDVEFKD